METRYLKMHDMKTRETDENGNPHLEGYFAVFDEVYDVWDGVTESIKPGAFDNSVTQDVRALYNHNHDIVLGRVSAGTLTLKQDSHGLWGDITLNRKDTDAMNAYERIARGDITGCSFGFDIKRESYEIQDDGTIHYMIEEVDPLWEVSPCVFPAYEATNISARGKDAEQIKQRLSRAWKDKMLARLKGEPENGTESPDASEEDQQQDERAGSAADES